MSRANSSIPRRKRHKKWIKRAKGFRGRRSSVFKLAKEAVLKSGQHAYHDRRKKKAQFRSLWQARINAAARQHDLSYSTFIHQLRQAKVGLNRKVLSEIASEQPDMFGKIVEKVK